MKRTSNGGSFNYVTFNQERIEPVGITFHKNNVIYHCGKLTIKLLQVYSRAHREIVICKGLF